MFVHLHAHSHFSFKDATPSPAELAHRAAELNMPAVALTDHNTLAGAIRFYTACQQAGVRPIIGCEISLESHHHVVLLAKDLAGYSNLCRLITRMHLDTADKPSPPGLKALQEFREGLICLSGCNHSTLGQDALTRPARAYEFLLSLKDIFAEDLFLELQNPLTQDSPTLLRQLSSLAQRLNLPLVATNNVHFLNPEGHLSRDVLVSMGENNTIAHPSPRRHSNSELYFKPAKTMEQLFASFPEAISNTVKIAEQCQCVLPLGQFRFPPFPAPKGVDSYSYLRQLCYQGLQERYPSNALPTARLEHELKVIRDMGFVEYFLVTWDIVSFARREGIRCSGRGSAADSLVAYVLGFTTVDPVANNLLFERFLNPERKGMPDIDMDFDSSRRDEVLAYVYQRYEQNRVAMVGTVNTFSARSAVREVSKAMGFSQQEISHLSTFIPRTSASKLDSAIENLPELKGFPKGGAHKTLLKVCAEIDGAPRHLSVHSGGVVIGREPLTDLVALQLSANGVVITQYDKDDLETLGLVKMDLLGLRILSAIQDTVDSLRQEGIIVDIDNIPLDDAATYSLLRSTKTVGVFQLESPGMRELLGRLQPTHFSDVIANIALFRPGPMQADMISPFIARRHGKEPVKYSHPCLEPILAETYGVIVYQEQVLQVASAMGNLTLGQADILRRAMTKDFPSDKMEYLKNAFMAGAKQQGIREETAQEVFRQLSAFAAYGFNKAHAATFGFVSYQTAYLKAHFPAHFLANILNHQPMGFYPSRTILHEARIQGIKIMPPCLAQGTFEFCVKNKALHIGLKAIASFTKENYLMLKRAREKGEDLLALPFSASLWEKIAASGALEGLSNAKKPTPLRERLRREFVSTGLYYSAHPVELFTDSLKKLRVTDSGQLPQLQDQSKVRVAGLVVARQTPPTRSKQRVIFLTIEDSSGLVDIAVFAQAQQKHAPAALGAAFLLVEGVLRKTGQRGISITANGVWDLKQVLNNN